MKNKDQIWRWKQLKGCLKFWSVSMRIDEAREKKGEKNYRCQTRYSLDTCASISWRGHRKLSNIIVKCDVWSLNDVTRVTWKVWTCVHVLMHAMLVTKYLFFNKYFICVDACHFCFSIIFIFTKLLNCP